VRALTRLRAQLSRPTIRLKLTLWYGAMFLLAGGLLVSLTYVLVREGFDPSQQKVRQSVAERLDLPPSQFEPGPGQRPLPASDGLAAMPDGPTLPDVIHAVQEEQMQAQLNSLLAWSLVALGIMAVLSLGLGWFLAGRMLHPVHELTGLARRLSESTLDERIRLQRPPDELKELADTFDGMLERLDRAFAGQRAFVANASHELRTPLTIMRTELDVALADPELGREELEAMAAAMLDAIERSELLIDSLLVLARSEAPVDARPVDLAELVDEAVATNAVAADSRELSVEVVASRIVVQGDRALLERMVDNLVDNAVRHNVDGGWFRVATAVGGAHATVVVANSGPQIGEDDAARLFERFYRADASRSRQTGGYGLGLAIVRAVAEAHRGRAEASPLPEGGLEVRVTLPTTPMAPSVSAVR